MATPRSLSHYEYWWYDLIDIARSRHVAGILLRFDSARELRTFRDRFYAFRRALASPTADEVITRRDGLVLYFSIRGYPHALKTSALQLDDDQPSRRRPLTLHANELPHIRRFNDGRSF